VVEIQKGQQKLHNALENAHDHQLSREEKEEWKTILNWLTPTDYTSQQIDFIKRRQSGTGQWLLDSPGFQEWLQGDRKILFHPGIPGAGKTILTAIVIEHLNNQYYNNPNIGIAYIYCNFRRSEEQKLDDLLASILKQLSETLPSLPKAVRELYERYKTKRPSTDELLRALQSLATSYARVFVVVDGLDECERGCRMRLIEEAFNLQARYGVNIFMTSRFLPEITDKFDKFCSFEIRATREDIKRYLDNHIRQSSFTIQDMQEEIKIIILDAVDGMYVPR
jgi:Cdc6-like AAA superfamily ATPase